VGYTHLLHDSNSDDWNIPNVRLRTKVDYGKFGFFSEVNFAHTQRKDVNWLRLAYLIYNVNSDWEVHLGRVFLSAGKMTPPPFVLETVQYPIADMYQCYGWGSQVVGKFGDGWSLSADITGKSGQPFESDTNYHGMEFSARLKKQIGDFVLGGTVQIGSDYQRFGPDVTWKPRRDYHIRAAIVKEESDVDESDSRVGAYVLSVWKPLGVIEIHNQLDLRRHTTGKKVKDVVMTNGVRIFVDERGIMVVTADYQTVLSGRRESCFFLRTQIMF